jgi:hypothetical protein
LEGRLNELQQRAESLRAELFLVESELETHSASPPPSLEARKAGCHHMLRQSHGDEDAGAVLERLQLVDSGVRSCQHVQTTLATGPAHCMHRPI